ncbi:MAG: divergent PAP2 family protein, partial [Clostridia bacterium]|nr:divergent PAP2 family protein [Clostridia bacterium]
MFSLYALVTNYYLVAAVSGWIVAQILKAFTGVFKLQEFSVKTLFFGTGGMPSSHTAAVCGLFTACLLREGFGSPLIAISG